MRFPSTISAFALATLATAVPTSLKASASGATSLSLTPYLNFNLTTELPVFASDYKGQVGLFNQIEPAGNFTGEIDGMMPAVGHVELNYPSAERATHALATATFFLNTTDGDLLTLRAQGPVTTSGQTDGAVGYLLATLETQAESLKDLNWKSFVLNFQGAQSNGVQSGGGSLYEVVAN